MCLDWVAERALAAGVTEDEIADELAAGNDVVIEREDIRFVAYVSGQVHLKVNSRSRMTAPS